MYFLCLGVLLSILGLHVLVVAERVAALPVWLSVIVAFAPFVFLFATLPFHPKVRAGPRLRWRISFRDLGGVPLPAAFAYTALFLYGLVRMVVEQVGGSYATLEELARHPLFVTTLSLSFMSASTYIAHSSRALRPGP